MLCLHHTLQCGKVHNTPECYGLSCCVCDGAVLFMPWWLQLGSDLYQMYTLVTRISGCNHIPGFAVAANAHVHRTTVCVMLDGYIQQQASDFVMRLALRWSRALVCDRRL
jgi:hypothetical protein